MGYDVAGTKARRSAIALGGVAGLLALSGCASITSAIKDGSDAVIEVLPIPDQVSTTAPVHSPIVVRVQEGRLTDVAVTGPKGPLLGTMNESQTQWTSNSSTLNFGTQYAVSAKAVDVEGTPTERSVELVTVKPKKTVDGQFSYFMNNDTVGVGMPLRIEFSQPIKNRKAVEQNLKVTSSKPTVGAWSWASDNQSVTFRPQTFWPANSKIKVNAALKGIQTSPGIYGERDMTAGFKTGASMVSTVDANTLTMTVRKNGKVIRKIPVTTGKSGFETRSGIKPIMGKEGTVVMDAASGGTPVGSADYYRLTVHYSMRLTSSGEFVHAAPWSTGSQGRSSVSHGCVGMSTGNAIWLYDQSKVGDVVEVKNTGRKQDLGNGITEWNVKWAKWLARSKTGEQAVGPAAAKVKPPAPAATTVSSAVG
jgi:lipoprotein-anchoring transpeptidase ErfK/SrfK